MSGEVQVGHWTAEGGRTGCTVVVFPEATVASGEVRGGAPASREFALLDPGRTVQHVDAVVLSGGSAFGLAAADGVVEALERDQRGFETRVGRVPIVVGMSLFDLADGVPRPGAAAGRAAYDARTQGPWPTGRVGVGAGATLGKWRGPDHRSPGGLGHAVARSGEVEVHAVVAVNALGDIDDGTTVAEVLDGRHVPPVVEAAPGENTTIGVVWTNAVLTKTECRLLAEAGHDGFARALVPAHAPADGDALVAASLAQVEAPIATVRLLATVVVEQAIRVSAAAAAG